MHAIQIQISRCEKVTLVSQSYIFCTANEQTFVFPDVVWKWNSCLHRKWVEGMSWSDWGVLLSSKPPSAGSGSAFLMPYTSLPVVFSLFDHMFCCSDIVVKTPQNLQEPNSSEDSGCAAKNAFQEVPYSQRGEEMVHKRPEADYKRLLEACGGMPHKSN